MSDETEKLALAERRRKGDAPEHTQVMLVSTPWLEPARRYCNACPWDNGCDPHDCPYPPPKARTA